MVPLSSRAARISAQTLSSCTADQLIQRVRDAEEVTFLLNSSFNADIRKILLLIATLSRGERSLTVEFPTGGPTDGIWESLSQSMLGPLLGIRHQSNFTLASAGLRVPEGGHVDRARRLFCVPTDLLNVGSQSGFQADLGRWFRAAGVSIPTEEFLRVAALAFEANTNADEHGSLRVGPDGAPDPSTVYRCFHARLHDQPGPDLSAEANQFLQRHRQGYDKRGRWLEINVVDAGMGVAFPTFASRAHRLGSAADNIYAFDHATEVGQLAEVLARRISSKGYWGYVRSPSSVTGEGISLITRNVIRLGGFASLRAGRSIASLSGTSPNNAMPTKTPEYVIDSLERVFFGGTAWQLLVPLDAQATLAL
jgi:hypothetical protein